MCGRYALGLPRAQIHRVRGWNMQPMDWEDADAFEPRHNIAPRSRGVVIRRRRAGGTQHAQDAQGEQAPQDSELVMQTMRWGLIPHWSKHEDQSLSTTNARAEGLAAGGGMWAPLRGTKRCVVVCQGYYEWLKKGKEKLPHLTRNKGGERLMLLAGLYDSVVLEGSTEPLWTFTIVTTDANREFSWLHDRQPVILSSQEAVDAWLDTSTAQWSPALTQLVKPYHDDACPLECYQVPKEVGKVGTESSAFIEPVAGRKGGIEDMFAKQVSGGADKSVPGKRKDISGGDTTSNTATGSKPMKRPKIEKLDAWEDETTVDYTDSAVVKPEEPTIKAEAQRTPTKKKPPSSPKKQPTTKRETSPSKGLTQTTTLDHFFGRKKT